jgi:hypothetical protein
LLAEVARCRNGARQHNRGRSHMVTVFRFTRKDLTARRRACRS